ncbi:hypothetical protein ACH42_01765 [Endozoicomonas sp. (ex Bugula neritina AB1)]|nr:hypothetical protein ACH42_01765 [Endozoicomonas sp. (ex Bugula neritina AB1)]
MISSTPDIERSVAENDNVLVKLRNQKRHMTPALGKVAEYVISKPDVSIHHTLVELAGSAGASEASVVRFCRDLGYNSFAAFKIALSISLLKETPVATGQSSDSVDNSLTNTVDSLRDTATLLDRGNLDYAVDLIGDAGCIYFFGVGASAVIADYGKYRMMRLGFKTHSFSNMHSAIMTISCMKENDLLVLMSGSGNTQDVIRTAQQARKQGGKVMAVTGNPKGELARLSNICLQTAVPESPFSAGALSSKASQMFMIDVLASSVLEKNPDLNDSVTRTAASIAFCQ